MAGRKVFQQETLSVPDVQGYLMDQAVMRFATQSARDAAIPVAQRQDGMVAWTDDLRAYTYVSGGTWWFLGASPWTDVFRNPSYSFVLTPTFGQLLPGCDVTIQAPRARHVEVELHIPRISTTGPRAMGRMCTLDAAGNAVDVLDAFYVGGSVIEKELLLRGKVYSSAGAPIRVGVQGWCPAGSNIADVSAGQAVANISAAVAFSYRYV